jgi:hypothetical protein
VVVFACSVSAGFADAGASSAGAQTGEAARVIATAPPHFKPALSRIVSARLHHTRLRTGVRKTNARRVGRSLASLRPTWVTGTLRYARGQYPERGEVRTLREVQRIVRQQSPGAQFDVVLNGLQYRTRHAISKMMARLRATLHPNGWFFDFLSQAHRKHPWMVRAAIASAHRHGEWIGGNVFGLARRRPLPAGVDYYSVQDHVFHLNLPAVRRLAERKPVVYHLNSDPAHERSGGCRFMQRFNTAQRRSLIRRRAAQQVHYGFRFSYPVLYPQCIRDREGRGTGSYLYAYNAFREPPVASEIRVLLDRHERLP